MQVLFGLVVSLLITAFGVWVTFRLNRRLTFAWLPSQAGPERRVLEIFLRLFAILIVFVACTLPFVELARVLSSVLWTS